MNLWNNFVEITKQDFFNPIINLINVLMIFVTSLVAYLSWKVARKANELKVLPLFAIYFQGKSMKDRTVMIKNIGNSPAYDIEIESFIYIIKDIQKVWKLDFSMGGTNVLVANEEKDLTLNSTINEKRGDIQEFLVFYLDPEECHERSRIELVLTFRNVEGKKYYSEVETGVGGLYIKPVRRLDFIRKMGLFVRKIREKTKLNYYKNFIWKFTEPHFEQTKNKNK